MGIMNFLKNAGANNPFNKDEKTPFLEQLKGVYDLTKELLTDKDVAEKTQSLLDNLGQAIEEENAEKVNELYYKPEMHELLDSLIHPFGYESMAVGHAALKRMKQDFEIDWGKPETYENLELDYTPEDILKAVSTDVIPESERENVLKHLTQEGMWEKVLDAAMRGNAYDELFTRTIDEETAFNVKDETTHAALPEGLKPHAEKLRQFLTSTPMVFTLIGLGLKMIPEKVQRFFGPFRLVDDVAIGIGIAAFLLKGDFLEKLFKWLGMDTLSRNIGIVKDVAKGLDNFSAGILSGLGDLKTVGKAMLDKPELMKILPYLVMPGATGMTAALPIMAQAFASHSPKEGDDTGVSTQ